jgi:hypothetical protein
MSLHGLLRGIVLLLLLTSFELNASWHNFTVFTWSNAVIFQLPFVATETACVLLQRPYCRRAFHNVLLYQTFVTEPKVVLVLLQDTIGVTDTPKSQVPMPP